MTVVNKTRRANHLGNGAVRIKRGVSWVAGFIGAMVATRISALAKEADGGEEDVLADLPVVDDLTGLGEACLPGELYDDALAAHDHSGEGSSHAGHRAPDFLSDPFGSKFACTYREHADHESHDAHGAMHMAAGEEHGHVAGAAHEHGAPAAGHDAHGHPAHSAHAGHHNHVHAANGHEGHTINATHGDHDGHSNDNAHAFAGHEGHASHHSAAHHEGGHHGGGHSSHTHGHAHGEEGAGHAFHQVGDAANGAHDHILSDASSEILVVDTDLEARHDHAAPTDDVSLAMLDLAPADDLAALSTPSVL